MKAALGLIVPGMVVVLFQLHEHFPGKADGKNQLPVVGLEIHHLVSGYCGHALTVTKPVFKISLSPWLRLEPGRKFVPSPRLAIMVPWFMAKTSVVPKKKRGPAPTGKGTQVGERWHPTELAAIDAWIASSSDKTLTRAHAIRRLVAIGLKVKVK